MNRMNRMNDHKGPEGPGLSEVQRAARAIRRRARNAERAAEDRVLGRGPWRRKSQELQESEGFIVGARAECVRGEPSWVIGARGTIRKIVRSSLGVVDLVVTLDEPIGREKEIALPPFCWRRIQNDTLDEKATRRACTRGEADPE